MSINDKILESLQVYTIIAICLELIIFNLPGLMENGFNIDLIDNSSNVIVLISIIFSLLIFRLLLEKYTVIIQILFKKSMLEYTRVKKLYNQGAYDIKDKPIKSYDKLPTSIKTEIDKLDDLTSKEKIPKLFDLIIALLNSSVILGYCIHMWNSFLLIPFGYIIIGLGIVLY